MINCPCIAVTQYRMTWRVQSFDTCNGKKCVKYLMNGHESTFKKTTYALKTPSVYMCMRSAGIVRRTDGHTHTHTHRQTHDVKTITPSADAGCNDQENIWSCHYKEITFPFDVVCQIEIVRDQNCTTLQGTVGMWSDVKRHAAFLHKFITVTIGRSVCEAGQCESFRTVTHCSIPAVRLHGTSFWSVGNKGKHWNLNSHCRS